MYHTMCKRNETKRNKIKTKSKQNRVIMQSRNLCKMHKQTKKKQPKKEKNSKKKSEKKQI